MASNTHVGSLGGTAHTTYLRENQSSVNIATDGSVDIYYAVDGTVASAASTKLAAGAAREVNVLTPKPGPSIVSVFAASGTPAYSICPGSTSLSRPPHTAGSALIDRYS